MKGSPNPLFLLYSGPLLVRLPSASSLVTWSYLTHKCGRICFQQDTQICVTFPKFAQYTKQLKSDLLSSVLECQSKRTYPKEYVYMSKDIYRGFPKVTHYTDECFPDLRSRLEEHDYMTKLSLYLHLNISMVAVQIQLAHDGSRTYSSIFEHVSDCITRNRYNDTVPRGCALSEPNYLSSIGFLFRYFYHTFILRMFIKLCDWPVR